MLWPVRLTAAPALPDVAAGMITNQAGFWRRCEKSADDVSSRDVFAYTLALGEAREHPERLDRLFRLVAGMQDQDPQSKGYGNFWWTKRDGKVMDANAVDFCMRGATLLWLKDRDFIPANARERLEKILNLAVEGCSRHHVKSSYSNIAIMNAGDLILLGEELNRPEVAEEGYARLDKVFRYTQAAGIHEFNSPTYTGVDLDGLGLIEAYCQRDTGRTEARALLELWWSDIAANWFPPAQRLAGANSRTYDFLRGLGELDTHLALNGWLPAASKPGIDTLFAAETRWRPSADLLDGAGRFPRLVRESWDTDWYAARTHYLLPEITLSASATSYGGRMDMPLTVDWPGPRTSVRGYFVADGRNDPYGKITIAAGAHEKAFHLNPFWAAAQRTTDALGLAVYREKDVPAGATTLDSDFVVPMAVDAIWLGDHPVTFTAGQAVRMAVPPGEVVALRKGQAVLGMRVTWARARNGQTAPVYLVYDGNTYGAIRLAVEHNTPGTEVDLPGAAFWLRIGSGIKSDEDFTQWRNEFAAAKATVDVQSGGLHITVPGVDGPVSVSATAPWAAPAALDPMPTRAVLELDGADIGRPILEKARL